MHASFVPILASTLDWIQIVYRWGRRTRLSHHRGSMWKCQRLITLYKSEIFSNLKLLSFKFDEMLFVCGQTHWPEFCCFPHFELRLGDSWTISDLCFDLMVSGLWHFKGTVCTVILRCCMPKSGKKCRSYVTLKHQRILNLQFDQFFRGLKRGVLTKSGGPIGSRGWS